MIKNSVSSSHKEQDESRMIHEKQQPWWNTDKPTYAFSDLPVKLTLKKLMGTNVVDIFNDEYNIKLQKEIKKCHLKNQKERIEKRRIDEITREKNVTIERYRRGESSDFNTYPVGKVNQAAEEFIRKQNLKTLPRDRMKLYRTVENIVVELPNSSLEEPIKNEQCEKCNHGDDSQCNVVQSPCNSDPHVDMQKGLMLSDEQYKLLKYDNPLLKSLDDVKNVEELYKVADTIIKAKFKV